MKKICIGIIVILVCMLLCAETKTKNNQTGHLLLDRLIQLFPRYSPNILKLRQNMSQSLQSLMLQANHALQEKKIDSTFYKRYHHILMILQISLLSDPAGILRPWIDSQQLEFIDQVEGYQVTGEEMVNYIKLAEAIEKEVKSLRQYLEENDGEKGKETKKAPDKK